MGSLVCYVQVRFLQGTLTPDLSDFLLPYSLVSPLACYRFQGILFLCCLFVCLFSLETVFHGSYLFLFTDLSQCSNLSHPSCFSPVGLFFISEHARFSLSLEASNGSCLCPEHFLIHLFQLSSIHIWGLSLKEHLLCDILLPSLLLPRPHHLASAHLLWKPQNFPVIILSTVY